MITQTDVNVKNVDKRYCVRWEKSFAYHAMFPLSLTFEGPCAQFKKTTHVQSCTTSNFVCDILQNLLCGDSKFLRGVSQIYAPAALLKGIIANMVLTLRLHITCKSNIQYSVRNFSWDYLKLCERLFSSSGYIVNKTRLSIEPNNVNTLVCLRCWLKNVI